MKILVTGASGFIGSFIVSEGLDRGHEVWAGVRRSSSRQYLTDSRIRFAELDLGNSERLRQQLNALKDAMGGTGWDYGNTTRLVVEFPYVVDHCNNAYYNILNGQIIVNEEFDMIPNFPTEGTVVYPLIQYHTQYDGNKLTVYN